MAPRPRKPARGAPDAGDLPVGATTPDGGTVVPWHREALVEADGRWYYARHHHDRVQAARRMLALDQRRSPVLDLTDTGEDIPHPYARRPDGLPMTGRRHRPAVAGRPHPPAQPQAPAPLRDPQARARTAAHGRPATAGLPRPA